MPETTGSEPKKPEVGLMLDPYADLKTVSSRIDYVMDRDRDSRTAFARNWFMCISFRAGWQWIIFDNTTRRFRAKSLPAWFPRVVSNKFGEKASDLVASYLQGRVPIRYLPATDND